MGKTQVESNFVPMADAETMNAQLTEQEKHRFMYIETSLDLLQTEVQLEQAA